MTFNIKKIKFINSSIVPTKKYLRILFNNKNSFLNKRLIFFNRGRESLRFALNHISGIKYKKILVPPSICESVLEVINNEGIKINYYLLDKNLHVDIDNLKSKIDNNIGAIYINYFFGFIYSIDNIKKLCKEKNILLILDCAHVLSNYKLLNKLKPDFIISSPRKFLPIPNGGILFIKNLELLKSNKLTVIYFKDEIKDLSKFFLRKIKYSNKIVGKLYLNFKKLYKKNKLQELNSSLEKNKNQTKYKGISSLSKNYISKFNFETINNQRIKNLNYYFQLSRKFKNIKPIFKRLEYDYSPYCFPIYSTNRMEVVNKASEYGLVIEPTLEEVKYKFDKSIINDKNFESLSLFMSSILSLPIHQDLSEKELYNIIYIVSSFNKI